MKSTDKKTHEIDLSPIRAALAAADKTIIACIDNEAAITAERNSASKSIDDIKLEDLEAQSDFVLDEAKRDVRIRVREGHQAKLCEARRAAATELMGAFLDLQGVAIDSVNREQWELKAKVEEALQPVIVRYTPNEARFLENAWLTLLDPYYRLTSDIGALDNATANEDRVNRHGFYKARSQMLIASVEKFNKRGVWLTPERETAAV